MLRSDRFGRQSVLMLALRSEKCIVLEKESYDNEEEFDEHAMLVIINAL